MSGGLVLRASGSHLYPGARGGVEGAPLAAGVTCLVEFADGSAAVGGLERDGDGLILATGSYTTARGTTIPAKRWRIAADDGAFRVVRRV